MRHLRWKETTMQRPSRQKFAMDRILMHAVAAAALPLLAGCGVTMTTVVAPGTTSPAAAVTYTGRVMGAPPGANLQQRTRQVI